MSKISYARHHFPLCVIQHAIWRYLRFNLSLRDVEDLLAERGIDVSYETIRRWVVQFGTAYARTLRRRRPTPDDRWHLDEMFVSDRRSANVLVARSHEADAETAKETGRVAEVDRHRETTVLRRGTG